MNEIQPLIDVLQSKVTWLAGFIGIARLLAKPLSSLVQSFFSKVLLFVQGTPETDDDAWLERLLASRWYRAFAFIVDWLLSVKLPTSASVQKVVGSENIAPPLVSLLLTGLLGFGALAMTTGCNTTQQRIAFNSLATVQTVTVSAYDGYVSQVVSGNISTNDVPKVSQRFNQFQASFRIALDAAQYNTNALAPDSLQVISKDLLSLITELSKKD